MEKKDKILTIAIPCYNSEDYMDRAIKSCLINEDCIEIIIVDDGSKDKTTEKADKYAADYPDIVKVIHKENGGHGDAVMTGLKNATGRYFKVLDSDDWLGKKALKVILTFLEENEKLDTEFDMLISDYVYEKLGKKKKKRITYRGIMPSRTSFTWDEIGKFKPWKNILMHSVIYRTDLLRHTGLTLPKHTFYVDNIYVYHPLPYMKKLYYIDVDLYHYFIGRDDQSVNEKNMLNRIDQQLLVTKILIKDHPLRTIENKKLRRYLSQYLAVMMAVSTSFLLKDGSPEALAKRDDLWQFLKDQKQGQYKYVSRHILGLCMQMRSKFGTFIIKIGYKISQKLIGFN